MIGEPPILAVRNLTVSFRSDAGPLRAVDGVDFDLASGRTLALVGESGCGKTVIALSIMRLLDSSTGSIDEGEISFRGENLLALAPGRMRRIRGDRISMIFQEPMTAMNPVLSVGAQVGEVFRIHRGYGCKAAREAAIEALRGVGIPDPGARADEYPFQFSGGMLQRAMIAMALACEPELLIADEPTTALDVTIQAQILDLLDSLQRSHTMAILLITHDLGVVAEVADDVAVMYGGRIVERGPADQVLADPRHPYTSGLLAAMPRIETDRRQPLATVPGSVPSLSEMPEGCRFHPRCARAQDLCRVVVPAIEPFGEQRAAACHWVAGRLAE